MTGLFGRFHCDPSLTDYTGQVLVLAAGVFADKRISPEDQLFFAEVGCGCSPACHGHKVFGQFLKSGESAQFQRKDFLGVLKGKHLPRWAGSRLADIEVQDDIIIL